VGWRSRAEQPVQTILHHALSSSTFCIEDLRQLHQV